MIDCARGFSLIEILVVIAILAILMVLTVPALTGMGGGRGVEAAGRTMANQLESARAHAMSQRRPTAIAIRTTGDGAFRSFTVIHMVEDGNGGYEFRQFGGWNQLPRGIFFDPDSSFFSSAPTTQINATISQSGVGLSPTDFVHQTFLPSGRMDLAQGVSLRIFEGVPTGTGVEPRTRDASNNPANPFDIYINVASGRFKSNRA